MFYIILGEEGLTEEDVEIIEVCSEETDKSDCERIEDFTLEHTLSSVELRIEFDQFVTGDVTVEEYEENKLSSSKNVEIQDQTSTVIELSDTRKTDSIDLNIKYE